MSNETKFDWLATESAPQHYPMEIIQGAFYYHGADRSLYIPYGGTLSSGWGHGISNHHVHSEPQPLPDRLSIVFFSYAEKQFYKGEFDLPYDKILALFRDGVDNPTDFGNGLTRPVYSKVMVGIAPGGAVAVWVTGKKTAEVFFGQAEKTEIDPGRAFRLPFKDKADSDAYIQEGLVEDLSTDELESLKKNGIPFGLWARYRNLYNWGPTAIAGNGLEHVSIYYLNGEFFGQGLGILAANDAVTALRPVPRMLSFRSLDKTLYTVTLDEFETMDAFEKLGANGQKVYMEFDPRLPRENIKVRLYNDKESIELKKFVSKK